jgi:hypothetical protein
MYATRERAERGDLMIGRIPKKLMDSLTRHVKAAARSFDTIMDIVVAYSQEEGFEILMRSDSSGNTPVFIPFGDEYPAVIARKRGDSNSIGVLGVHSSSGQIKFTAYDETLEAFKTCQKAVANNEG